MLTATGYCSQRLATDFGIDAPTAQSFLNYALLSLHGFPRWLRSRRDTRTVLGALTRARTPTPTRTRTRTLTRALTLTLTLTRTRTRT